MVPSASQVSLLAAAHATPPSPSTASSSPLTSSSTIPQWVVHKFGGTSLASSECYRNALSIILHTRRQQQAVQAASASSSSPTLDTRLCVVVSAMGEVKPTSQVGRLMAQYHRGEAGYRPDKQDKVTNLLIRCTELAAHHDHSYKLIVAELRRRHMQVIDELISQQMVEEYQQSMEQEEEATAELKQQPATASASGQLSPDHSPAASSPASHSASASPVSKPASYHYSHSDHGESTSSSLAMSLLHMKETLRSLLEKDLDDLSFILRACWLSRAFDLEHNWWFGYGELWSARLICTFINAVLLALGQGPGRSNERAVWLDAREALVLARTREPMPDYAISQERLDAWLSSSIEVSTAKIVVVTGYIASAANGMPTTLGRDGSDYSAAIFAALLKADHAVIWTDVDGVYSANPAQVADAVLLSELSYDEASELAYFGAKVLHPKTMTPVLALEIPIWIRNTFNYSSRGSCILSARAIAEQERRRQSEGGERPAAAQQGRAGVAYGVKGFSEISNLALIEVKGTGLIGVPGIASRLFSRVKDANCSVVLVTQAGSELSMCMAVPMSQSDVALAVVRREFRDELLTREILSIEKTGPCACLAVVGDGMRHKRGVAGRVFGALADAGVNVQAIAQGSSERNISAIIAQADVNRALLAVHSAFLTPEGAEGDYSPLLKGRLVPARTLTDGDSEGDEYEAAFRLKAARAKATRVKAAEELKLKAEEEEEAERDDYSHRDKDRVERELGGSEDAQLSALRRSYRLFTRDIVLKVCLVTGGWPAADVDVLRRRLSQAWGERKEVKVSLSLLVDVRARQMVDTEAGQAVALPLSWESLLQTLTSWSSFSSSCHAVVIDCSDSESVVRQYRHWLSRGVRLITQRQLQSPLAALHSLPVFATLYDLQQRKEAITRLEAVLPCPLSFAFTAPASIGRITPRAVRDSHDAAKRMMRALALALGCDVQDGDIRCDAAFTALQSQPEIEREVAAYKQRAAEQGMAYAYVASITLPSTPSSSASPALELGMRLCPACHPFGWLKGYNSSLMIYTENSGADALVLQGPATLTGEGEGAGLLTAREEEMEREREKQRAASGLTQQVEHALAQFQAIVSDVAK